MAKRQQPPLRYVTKWMDVSLMSLRPKRDQMGSDFGGARKSKGDTHRDSSIHVGLALQVGSARATFISSTTAHVSTSTLATTACPIATSTDWLGATYADEGKAPKRKCGANSLDTRSRRVLHLRCIWPERRSFDHALLDTSTCPRSQGSRRCASDQVVYNQKRGNEVGKCDSGQGS